MGSRDGGSKERNNARGKTYGRSGTAALIGAQALTGKGEAKLEEDLDDPAGKTVSMNYSRKRHIGGSVVSKQKSVFNDPHLTLNEEEKALRAVEARSLKNVFRPSVHESLHEEKVRHAHKLKNRPTTYAFFNEKRKEPRGIWDLAFYVQEKVECVMKLYQNINPATATDIEEMKDNKSLLKELAVAVGVDLLPESLEGKQSLVERDMFVMSMVAFTVFTVIFIGTATDSAPPNLPYEERWFWFVGELLICLVFTIECVLRFKVHGWWYLDRYQLDLICLVANLLDNLFLSPMRWTEYAKWMDLFYLPRLLRVEKLSKVMKAVPFIWNALNTFLKYNTKLVTGGLFWTFIFCALVTNMFAILCKSVIGLRSDLYLEFLKVSSWDWRAHWGTVHLSYLSLMRMVAFDQNVIEEAIRPVLDNQWDTIFLFIFFILIMCYGLMNVFCSMVVAVAVNSTDQNREFHSNVQHKSRQIQLTKLGHLFDALDVDANKTLSREELEDAMNDPLILDIFMECEIPFDEAMELFDILDRDGVGEMAIDEYLGACSRVRGEAKSKDSYIIKLATECVNVKMDELNKEFLNVYTRMLQLDNIIGNWVYGVYFLVGNINSIGGGLW